MHRERRRRGAYHLACVSPSLTQGLQCSWLFLNRHTVRGDLALAFYTGAFCVLYTAARFLPAIGLEATPFKSASTIAATYFVTLASTTVAYRLSPWHPLASYPGPIVCRISSLWLTAVSLKGFRHVLFGKLHERYGPFVRLGSPFSPVAG